VLGGAEVEKLVGVVTTEKLTVSVLRVKNLIITTRVGVDF